LADDDDDGDDDDDDDDGRSETTARDARTKQPLRAVLATLAPCIPRRGSRRARATSLARDARARAEGGSTLAGRLACLACAGDCLAGPHVLGGFFLSSVTCRVLSFLP